MATRAERDRGWKIDRVDDKFEASRMIVSSGVPGEGPGEYQEINVEQEGDRIEVFVRSGDAHGSDYQAASIDLDPETARAFVEWLAPRLYGEDVPQPTIAKRELESQIADAEVELRDAEAEYERTSSRDSYAWPAAQARCARAKWRLSDLRKLRAAA